MNLEAQIERYRRRGFPDEEAQILVLLESAASGICAAFPGRFVLIGGATLVLLYQSQRVSRDLDLAPRAGALPEGSEIADAIKRSVQPHADALAMGDIELRNLSHAGAEPTKILVQARGRVLFSVDLTRIGGAVLDAEVVGMNLPGGGAVLVPSADYLLLQKCETFLNRKKVKARDAFDINLLLGVGANLSPNLGAHLRDFIHVEEIEAGDIRLRIDAVDRKLCTVELKNTLPHALFLALVVNDFVQLRSSLETVFKEGCEDPH